MTVFRWYGEFIRRRSSLGNEKRPDRSGSVVTPENMIMTRV